MNSTVDPGVATLSAAEAATSGGRESAGTDSMIRPGGTLAAGLASACATAPNGSTAPWPALVPVTLRSLCRPPQPVRLSDAMTVTMAIVAVL